MPPTGFFPYCHRRILFNSPPQSNMVAINLLECKKQQRFVTCAITRRKRPPAGGIVVSMDRSYPARGPVTIHHELAYRLINMILLNIIRTRVRVYYCTRRLSQRFLVYFRKSVNVFKNAMYCKFHWYSMKKINFIMKNLS